MGSPFGREPSAIGEVGSSLRDRLPSGVPGLDEVLGGGFLTGGIYIVGGGPGTGKTVLANQVCFNLAAAGERCVYVTMVSESHSRMIANLETLAFFRPDLVNDRITYVSAVGPLRNGGPVGLFDLLEEEIRRVEPRLLVLDGLRIGMELAQGNDLDMSVLLNRLAALLEFTNCTAIAATLCRNGTVAAEHAIADGLIELTYRRVGVRNARELTVCKFRGSAVLEGSHFVEIDARGLVVYPRVEVQLAGMTEERPSDDTRHAFGVAGLDDMLRGGIPRGSATSLLGVTGTGKTLLGVHFLATGAERGERGLYFGCYESPQRVVEQAEGVGIPLARLSRAGSLDLVWQRPFENLLDRVIHELFDQVREQRVERLFIDGLDGLVRGALYPERAMTLLAAVSQELRRLGVTALLSVEGEPHTATLVHGGQWSALVENLVYLRYVEAGPDLRRVISVIKIRASDFDASAREMTIGSSGIEVAATSGSARTILAGPGAQAATGAVPGGGRR